MSSPARKASSSIPRSNDTCLSLSARLATMTHRRLAAPAEAACPRRMHAGVLQRNLPAIHGQADFHLADVGAFARGILHPRGGEPGLDFADGGDDRRRLGLPCATPACCPLVSFIKSPRRASMKSRVPSSDWVKRYCSRLRCGLSRASIRSHSASSLSSTQCSLSKPCSALR